MTTIKASRYEFPLMSSGEVIGSNEDIMTNILFRVPVKSAFRFKLVSKHWNSFISTPRFRLLCQHRSQEACKSISHLFVLRQHYDSIISTYDIFPIFKLGRGSGASFSKALNYVDVGQTKIVQSCNGLLCFRTYQKEEGWKLGKLEYHVCNPTTRQYKTLPDPISGEIGVLDRVDYEYRCIALNIRNSSNSLHLAFDPRKSPHFKVLLVYLSAEVDNDDVEFEIYSSQTGQWKRVGVSFPSALDFGRGVYWNGAINWLNNVDHGLYFNVDEERFGTMPDTHDYTEKPNTIYFGESYDHLFQILDYNGRYYNGSYGLWTKFNIFEMDKEYSGWSLRYTVDTEVIARAFPRSSLKDFQILTVVYGENEKDLYVVLFMDERAIRYNLDTNCFKKIWNFGATDNVRKPVFRRMLKESFQYTESLCNV